MLSALAVWAKSSEKGGRTGWLAVLTACGSLSCTTTETPNEPPTSTGGSSSTGGIAAASGGALATGGASATGGTASGGAPSPATGGTSTGGKATGGNATGGTATGGSATGGKATGGSATGGTSSTSLFSQCRFHFCAGDWVTTASIRTEIDYFTSGWLLGVNFNHSGVCTETNSGGALAGKLPVMMSYIAADYVKRTHNLCDCNVSGCSGGNLCSYGAQYITQDWANILSLHTNNSNGFAGCMGGRPIVFAMEPDWYQYTISGQSQPWTAAQAGTNMTALVNALKSNTSLRAYFSMDVSPWIPNNGSAWYSNFNLGLFTFINTSGGGTDANNTRIRSNNAMTWAGVNQVTGKPILADTGYGAAGSSAGEDAIWNVAANINARMADGVVGICQYNPTSSWGSTIAGIRSQLNTPRYCP
jgi:hypothetical protein